ELGLYPVYLLHRRGGDRQVADGAGRAGPALGAPVDELGAVALLGAAGRRFAAGGPLDQHVVDQLAQRGGTERLPQRGDRAELPGELQIVQLRLQRAAARDRDDRDRGVDLLQLADGGDAFLVRHDDVGDDEIGAPLAEAVNAIAAVRDRTHS